MENRLSRFKSRSREISQESVADTPVRDDGGW